MTFLIVPLLDPDGADEGVYENITKTFELTGPNAATTYARFFLGWVIDGKRLDLVVNLHNIESAERNANLLCPVRNLERPAPAASNSLDEIVSRQLGAKGYIVDAKLAREKTYAQARLGGWLAYQFGPMHVLYELNSQAPSKHLSLGECAEIGKVLVSSAEEFMFAAEGLNLRRRIDSGRETIASQWRTFEPKQLARTDPFAATMSVGLHGE
jgi:hypothetical protein